MTDDLEYKGRIREGARTSESQAGTPGRVTPTTRLPPSTGSIARALARELQAPSTGAAQRESSAAHRPAAHGDAPAGSPFLDQIQRAHGRSQVQLDSGSAARQDDPSRIHQLAAAGTHGAASTLPHLERVQAAFGHHDVSGVRAHVGGAATAAAGALGARGYAVGDDVAFAAAPDLRLAAHEAAHVVQQRGGVRLDNGVGRSGDAYERHADAVADLVVRGESAQALLDVHAHRGATGGPAVQRDGEGETEHEGERRTPPVAVAAVREIPLFERDFRTRWGNLHIESKALGGITTEGRPPPGEEPAVETGEGIEAARGEHGTEVNVHSTGRLRDLLMRDCHGFADRFDLDVRSGGGRFRAGAQTAAINVFDLGQLTFQFNLIDVRAGNQTSGGAGPLQVQFGSLEAAFQHQCSGTEFVNMTVQIAARFDPNWTTIIREIGRRIGRQVVEEGAAEAGAGAAEAGAAEAGAAEAGAAEAGAAEVGAAEAGAAEVGAAEAGTGLAEAGTAAEAGTGLAEAGAAGLEGAELASAGIGTAGAGTVAMAVAAPVLGAIVIVGGTMWAMHNAAEEGRRIGLATWYIHEYAVQFADRIYSSHGHHYGESQTGRGTARARRAGEGRSDAREAVSRLSQAQRDALRRQYPNRAGLERHLSQELAQRLNVPAIY